MRRVAVLITAGIALLGGASAQARAAELVSITTPRGVKQSFILIKPEKPVASVILFAGGNGDVGLKSATEMKAWATGNFLIRTRNSFAAHGLAVAVVDAPSDKAAGMNAIFRMSKAHREDIGAVAAYMKKLAGVPVWLVGTSMGTFSAAEGAINAKNIDGLVLTSTITRSHPNWKIARSHPNGVASMSLNGITVPALILSHRDDQCRQTPSADMGKLKNALSGARRVDVVLLEGGNAPRTEPCEAYAQHGFYGIEAKAVDTIVEFIKSNGKSERE